MPLLERRDLASGTVQRENFVTVFRYDFEAVKAANPMASLKLDFSNRVIKSSLRLKFEADRTVDETAFRGLIKSHADISSSIRVFRGEIFFIGTSAFTINSFRFADRSDPVVQEVLANPATPDGFTILGNPFLGTIDNQGFATFPGVNGFSLILSMARPAIRGKLGFFAFHQYQPYTLTVTVSGFEGTEFAQDSITKDELVSAFLIDKESQALYGKRPNTTELQSDFIENQTQAIRVGEAFFFQKNMVLGADIVTTFNPSIKRGATIRLVNSNSNIIFHGIVKTVGHSFDFSTGNAVTEISAKSLEYIFKSFLGVKTSDEKLDERQ